MGHVRRDRAPAAQQATESRREPERCTVCRDTAHHAGAPTIAREQPQSASRRRSPLIAPGLDAEPPELIFYDVTISK